MLTEVMQLRLVPVSLSSGGSPSVHWGSSADSSGCDCRAATSRLVHSLHTPVLVLPSLPPFHACHSFLSDPQCPPPSLQTSWWTRCRQ